MKKILLAALIFGSAVAVKAQVKLGVKAGANLANWNYKILDEKEPTKMLAGLQAGFVADISLGKSFSFQPQLLFSGKGYKEEHMGHDDKVMVSSIDIPLNLVYKVPVGFGKVFFGAGPNIGYNLSAKVKGHDEPDEKIEIGSGADQIKALDFGVNAIAGLELKKNLFFSVNYTLGLTNLSNISTVTSRSNILGVSIGYFFFGK